MTLRTLAYAAEEPLLLTFDGAELLAAGAIDGVPKWQLTLPRAVAGVVLGSPHAVPIAAGNPWRSAGATHVAFAVDVAGDIQVVDTAAGTLVTTVAGSGSPTALAASTSALAIGTAEHVVLWRDGERREIAVPATALAFSAEGTKLAIGAKSGAVIIADLHAAELERHTVKGEVTVIAAHGDAWLIATTKALWATWRSEPVRVLDQPVDALAVLPGERVAVGVAERVAIYEWQLARRLAMVELTRRDVHDLAYGPKNRLGVGLNRGDAAIVDEQLRISIRVGPHPGRPKPRWHARVDVELERRHGATVRARTGLGAAGAIVAVAAIFVSHLDQPTPTPPFGPSVKNLQGLKCDLGCEATRIAELVRVCRDVPDADCQDDAEAALAAFIGAHCGEVHASLSNITTKVTRRTNDKMTLVRAYLALATMGLAGTCVEDVPTVTNDTSK